MYKFILCWRYLRTRFLAFVCIVSVMLGVATLVVVNCVIGVDPIERGKIEGFKEHLIEAERKTNPSFAIGKEAMARFERLHPAPPKRQHHPMQGGLPELEPIEDTPREPEGIIAGYAIC